MSLASLRQRHIVWLVPLGLALIAFVVEALGLRGDLPFPPDVDEPTFVRAALKVAEGHLTPGWYGHPASTLIYTLAMLIRLWATIADPSTITRLQDPALGQLLQSDPGPLYLLGRLVSAAFGAAAVGATWVLARRFTSAVGATFAAAVLICSPFVIFYGQITRDDTAGVFLALVFLILLLRAMDRRRTRDWMAAAVVLGLDVATRYFFASLGFPFVAAVLLSEANAGPRQLLARRSVRLIVAGALVSLAAFLIITPGIVLQPARALADIQHEDRQVHPGADGLSPLGNAGWYVFSIIPRVLGIPVLLLAAMGLLDAAFRRRRELTVVAVYAVTYLATASASPLHWDRYVIPVLPILTILAGTGVALGLDLVLGRRSVRSVVTPGLAPSVAGGRSVRAAKALAVAWVLVAAATLAPGAATVTADDNLSGHPSTRALATTWLLAEKPPGTVLCGEMYTAYPDPRLGRYRQVFALSDESLAWYRDLGCGWLLESSAMSTRFDDVARYPRQHAFYEALAGLPVVATFAPGPQTGGAEIRIYNLAGSQ